MITPQRIVFVNRYFDPDQSATSQMLTDLARSLVTRGLEVHVICSRQLYEEPGRNLPGAETLRGVEIHRVATTNFGRRRLWGRAMDYGSFYVACALVLLRLLERNDVLIAKTDPPLLSLLAAPMARLKGVKLINWQQDIFPETASRLGANPLPRVVDGMLRSLRDASLRAAVGNVVIGRRMREYLVARGVPEAKLAVIENWADSASIEPKPVTSSALRTRLDIPDRFVVCYSGNLGRAHEFETLLGAAEELAAETCFIFLIIGNGARMDPLRRGVAARGLENFRFLPHQPRDALGDSLAAADVHLISLLPELEGFIVPSKLYGILAAGRPLVFIGDPDGEIARVINGAQCGRVAVVGDGRGLASSLRELAADSVGRASMGMRARNLLCEKFSLERATERWLALIHDIIDERRTSSERMPPRKLAIVCTHPIQYYAPVFRTLQELGLVDLRVFYTWSQSAADGLYDPGFGAAVKWDIPLLEGYAYQFVPNVAGRPGPDHFWGLRTPTLLKEIEAWGPDAVLVYTWNSCAHLRALRHFKGRVPVLFRGDSTLLDPRSWWRNVLRRLALTWVYSHVDVAIAVGSHNRDYFAWCGLPPERIASAPHSVDTVRFAADSGVHDNLAARWRRELGIDREATVILFAGKLQPKKNPHLLLDAFSDLADRVHLVFVGNGELEGGLKAQAAPQARVHFMPFQNQSVMPAVYRLGDVFVLPSKGPEETWGLALNEAMASGRAVIASSRVGGARDLIQPGETGWIFESGDRAALTQLLRRAVDCGRARLHAMGRTAQAASVHWSTEASARRIGEAVLAVTGVHGAPVRRRSWASSRI